MLVVERAFDKCLLKKGLSGSDRCKIKPPFLFAFLITGRWNFNYLGTILRINSQSRKIKLLGLIELEFKTSTQKKMSKKQEIYL